MTDLEPKDVAVWFEDSQAAEPETNPGIDEVHDTPRRLELRGAHGERIVYQQEYIEKYKTGPDVELTFSPMEVA